MKKAYKCDFCDEVFSSEAEAENHEKQCGYNPQNKINAKVVFRLAMIYETIQKIIACALYEVAESELDFLYSEADRATETNFPYVIHRHKNKMLWALSEAHNRTGL